MPLLRDGRLRSSSFSEVSPERFAKTERLLALVKRQRHYLRAHAPAPDVDLELLARRASIGRQVRHADRLLEVRRLRTARDDACLLPVDVDLVPVPGNRAIENL